MGNIKSGIQKPDILKNLEWEPRISREETAKAGEQVSELLEMLLRSIHPLNMMNFKKLLDLFEGISVPVQGVQGVSGVPGVQLESRRATELNNLKIMPQQRERFTQSIQDLEAQVFRLSQWRYGIVVPSYEIGKKPVLNHHISIGEENLSTRGCTATFACTWTERDEELLYFQKGYCQALFKFIVQHLNLGANFNRSHQIVMKDKSQFCYLYAEQIIPKGYLDLNVNELRTLTNPEFNRFFESKEEGITPQTIQQFFETFGIFLPTRILYGGKRYIKKAFTHKELNFETKENIEIEVSSAFNLCQNLSGEFSVKGGRKKNFRSRNTTTTYKYIINTEGGNPEDSRSEKDWLRGLATDKSTWAVIKVEQFVPTIDLLEKSIGDRIRLYLERLHSKCFIGAQHQISASLPWFTRCVTARKFEGRCPRSYLDDGCKPISHEWSCHRCQREIYIDKSGRLYCDCRILKKTMVRFCCSDWDHLDTTVENERKHCKKSINDFIKGDGSVSKTSYCAKFWRNGDRYIGEFREGMLHGQGNYLWQGGTYYIGTFVNGKLSGIGQLCFTPIKDLYRGYFEQNKFNGQGQYFLDSGDSYEGQFMEGQKHGKGKYHFANGAIYEGGFVHDKPDGHGIYAWANGDEYEADFSEDKDTTKGTLRLRNSTISYSGEFKDGKPHGTGIITDSQIEKRFEGPFYDGRTNGVGVYINQYGTRFQVTSIEPGYLFSGEGELHYSNLDRYNGPIVKNRVHGKGDYIFSNGDSYKGQFTEGRKDGNGTYHFANGASYEGDFVNDEPSGYGIFTVPLGTKYEGNFSKNITGSKWKILYPNGDMYEGPISRGKPEGKGAYRSADGYIYEGLFAKGRIIDKKNLLSVASDTNIPIINANDVKRI